MRITVLCASGNTVGQTYAVASAFSRECTSRGHDAELVDLSAVEIRDCDGCKSCHDGEGCVIRDDMDALYPKLEYSDLIVFATPLRFNGVSSIMKRFIDRLNPFWFSRKNGLRAACAIMCGGSFEPVFKHAISELKSAAAVLNADWKGELLFGNTDNVEPDMEEVTRFAEKVLSSL